MVLLHLGTLIDTTTEGGLTIAASGVPSPGSYIPHAHTAHQEIIEKKKMLKQEVLRKTDCMGLTTRKCAEGRRDYTECKSRKTGI